MASTVLEHCLAGAAVLFAFIVVVLDGLVYGHLRSLHSPTSTAELAAVLLSTITCIILLMLSIFLPRMIRNAGRHGSAWSTTVLTFAGTSLLISTTCVAGTIVSHSLPNSSMSTRILIARSICWDLSVLTQGLYFGFLLVTFAQCSPSTEQGWPRSELQELEARPETPRSAGTCSPSPTLCDESYSGLPHFDTRRSSLRKYPRRSSRYSGATICADNDLPSKYEPFDTSPSTASLPASSLTVEHVPTHTQSPQSSNSNSRVDNAARRPAPALSLRTSSFRSSSSLRRKININTPPNIHVSLDTIVRQCSSTPSSTTIANTSPALESTSNLPETYAFYCSRKPFQTTSSVSLPCSPIPSPTLSPSHNLRNSRERERENNIHPLFRSTSPTPSPTPLPGSIVRASPSAGRTITQKTLMRMRSARELRASRHDRDWNQSADSASLPDPGTWMAMGRAGYVRSSVTRYEKKGDLTELTEERS